MHRREGRYRLSPVPITLFLVMMLPGQWVQAAERILSFHSDLAVQVDGSLQVTERIVVRAEGRSIRRGIFRDLPLAANELTLLSARRDGEFEKTRVVTEGNGVRIYLGRKDVLLEPGEYHYEIVYRVLRQLAYEATEDVLYWNVTGNNWVFPIDEASARVRLPEPVPRTALRWEAYTGVHGSRDSDVTMRFVKPGVVDYATRRSLGVGEGLTVFLAWPKEIVEQPPPVTLQESPELVIVGKASTRLDAVWRSAGPEEATVILRGYAALGILLAYLLLVWWHVGRDPEAGPLYPRYAPPANLSPAAVRLLWRQRYDDVSFIAALLGLATKGWIRIHEMKKNRFELELLSPAPEEAADLQAGERALLNELFGRRKRFKLNGHQARRIMRARQKQARLLDQEWRKFYFRSNRRWLVPAIVFTVVVAIGLMAMLTREERIVGLALMVMLFQFAVGTLDGLYRFWRERKLGLRTMLLIAVPLSALTGYLAWLVRDGVPVPLALTIVLMTMSLWWFSAWIASPTRKGQKLRDDVLGFRDYLQVAEREDLALRARRKTAVKRFVEYLPYAVALEVTPEWTRRYAPLLAGSGAQSLSGCFVSAGKEDWTRFGDTGFGKRLARAVDRSRNPPRRSRSRSGSGFSSRSRHAGGGRGGGGGGGW